MPSCPEFSFDKRHLLFIDGHFGATSTRDPRSRSWPTPSQTPVHGAKPLNWHAQSSQRRTEPQLVLGTFHNDYMVMDSKDLVEDPFTNTTDAFDVLTFTDCKPLSPSPGDVA